MDLVKHKADVVSDSNLTLSGEQTIDDVLTSTSRVLLTGQTDLSENGIWLTGAGAWTRVTDFNEESEVNEGLVIVLPGGTTYSNTIWTTVADIATIDTDDIKFIKLNSPFSIVAGDGLTLTVDTIDLVAADTSLTINANDVAVNLASNSGLEISTGLKILPDTTTANTLALTLTANGAGVKYNSTAFSESAEALTLANTVAGDGLDLTSQVLSVKVDDSTIEIDTDTLQVKDSGITYAKIQDITEDRLLGRNAGGDGPVQEITIGSGLA